MACGSSVAQATQASAVDPLIGRTVGGQYTIQEIVGVGGMGRVYRAEQGTLGRTVAVKVIHPHLLHDDQTVARFYTEARAASSLNHPNSVSIIDFGRSEDGILYLVMEFLRGADLAVVMQRDGPIPFGRICDILLPVLDALSEAHALDIVHRDLKPENILLRRFRSGGDLVKVVDFGLAAIVGDQGTQITRPGLVCGTPDYMSPEQARGDDVDGRGDLYSLGVVLFELLTESLPFIDDTPTKVVMRHIHDPIPDPRVVAPHRAIPDTLAQIAIKALQKRREDRYPNTAAMAAAIREARDRIGTRERETVRCDECGETSPAGMRFCGSCGARLRVTTGERKLPAQARRTSFYPTLRTDRPLVGRHSAVVRVESARTDAAEGLTWLRIEGEPGVGRSRLLAEVVRRSADQGDFVVGAGPHSSGAPVPYGVVRAIVAALLDVEETDLATASQRNDVFSDGLARAGLEELSDPRGLATVAGYSDRAPAVAAALAAAVRAALRREAPPRVILALDDVARCDELSQRALAQLPELLVREPVLVVSVGLPGGLDPSTSRIVQLEGLTQEEAEEFLRGEPSDRRHETPPSRSSRRLLPLYLDQLLSIGESQTDDSLPLRLSDAVAHRVDRLTVHGRRVLQAVAVLGRRCAVSDLGELVVDADVGDALGELSKKGFVAISGSTLEILHPLIGELVEASIPAEARKRLHLQAFELRSGQGAAAEIRAEHAYRSGEAFVALMILDVAGDRSLRLGATGTAVLYFRRALEVARREVIASGESTLESAVVTFSRKLGDALLLDGDPAGADGVLREALDLARPSSIERARMLVSLGRVAAHRLRRRDAMRLFGQAFEIIAGVDPDVEADVQIELGRIRRATGDARNAGNAYRRAIELLEELGASPLRLARASVALGEAELEDGAHDRAVSAFERARDAAGAAGARAVEATAIGGLGRVELARGNEGPARRRFDEAMALAAEAGDAIAKERWRKGGAPPSAPPPE